MRVDYTEKTISLKTIALFLVFLATLNTLNAYYYFVFMAFGVLFLFSKVKVVLNNAVIALFLLAISFVVFSPSYSYSILGILKPFTYIMCYIIGYGIYEYKEFDTNKSLKLFYIVCIFVIAGSFFHYLLNWVTNFSDYTSRNTVDFWTKTVIAATGQAPLACLAIAIAIAGIFSNTSGKIKIIAIIVILMALGYNLILSGRTLFILTLVVLLVAFIHKLINQKERKVDSVIIAVVVVVSVLTAFNFNLFGMRSKIEATPFYERFFTEDSTMEVDEDGRMENKMQYIENASKYLFGGSNLHEQFGYAHDIILDTYDEAGIVALLVLIIYLGGTVCRVIKCVSNKGLPFEFRQTILCIYTILYIQFMTEPIFQGVPWLFASFCVIDGSLTRVFDDYSKGQGALGGDCK